MREFIVLIRGLGVLLGLVVLGVVLISMIDGLPTTAVGAWIVGELSLLLLGLLLLAPWRIIVRWKFWWIPGALLTVACLSALAFLAPAVAWASFHGALGGLEILLGSIAILIGLGQLIAVWYLRQRSRSGA